MVNALIRTLPLSNGNYGGILQAMALQRALNLAGFDRVCTDVSRTDQGGSLAQLRRAARRKAGQLSPTVPASWEARRAVDRWRRPLDEFVAENIRTVRLHVNRRPKASVVRQTDLLVSGSDQVFRPNYGDVLSYAFVHPTFKDLPKVTYAASFGHDNLADWPRELREKFGNALLGFSRVSVREASAVALLKDEFGIAAEQHIDPTALLNPSEYRSIGLTAGRRHAGRPYILYYVLDETPTSREAVLRHAAKTRLPIDRITGSLPIGIGTDMLTIPEWLSLIDNAEYLVTDSFHGTLFALMLNTPFITVVNYDRGASRFNSLLQQFGMRERAIQSGGFSVDAESMIDALVSTSIDWSAVNAQLAHLRERGMAYLLECAVLACARQ